jgi:hypothetical protein
MPKIVLAGHDLHLLETRAEVLKRTGSDVLYCAAFQAFDVVKRELPDLLVLCHTLAHGEAEAIAEKVHVCCPNTRFLMVASQMIDDDPYPVGMFDATSLPEPARLIARTTELLKRMPPYYVTEIVPNKLHTV